MSKDNASLRLLGSPVNLTSRNKKKDDRKNIRNRPRSALQNSCYNPDNQERYKRPFSADTKERSSSTRNFYKTFSSELLQTYKNPNNSACEAPYSYPALSPGPLRSASVHSGTKAVVIDYPITTIKVVPPTADLLSYLKSDDHEARKERDKDICSNASDIGSEDTFISLGTKIKNKAQLIPRLKSPSAKNLKYRNIAKKGRKSMENTNTLEEKPKDEYGMEIKITERGRNQKQEDRNRDFSEIPPRTPSPSSKRSYDAYFIPLEGSSKSKDEDLSGRVSFGSSNIQAEVEQAIDTYSRRLTLTKQQLSLVEEESTQDIESPSQRISSLSPENLLEDPKKDGSEEILTGRNTYVLEGKNNEFPKTQNFMYESRTYTSFYDDFRSASPYKSKDSNTIALTDSSSKDSGYHDSGQNGDGYRQNYSLPSTSLKKSLSQTRIEDQPKSLDSASSNDKDYKTFPLDKKSTTWVEPLNHSRLLYKDFFLKKEGHIATAPQNSPVKGNQSILKCNENAADERKSETENNNLDYPSYLINSCNKADEKKSENQNDNLDYPSYLLHSTTKAYTSKVIEDYKKEIETINSLHELTIRDIKTDAISPTPLNIDKMFEQHSEEKHDINENPQSTKTNTKNNSSNKNKNSLDGNTDISKVSTKELIQKYLDVKREYGPKNFKKYDYKKLNNVVATADTSIIYKQDWNNKVKSNAAQVPKPPNLKNQSQKNVFTLRPPLSARIESVQNDKDIDSWMSMATSSPRNFDIEPIHSPQETYMQEPKIPERIASCESSPNHDNAHHNSSSNNTQTNGENTQNSEQKQSTQASLNSSTRETSRSRELNQNSTVLDIYSMLKEIESYGDNPVTEVAKVDVPETPQPDVKEVRNQTPKDNFMEIFEFLEKVEQSANDALNVVTTTTPQTIPKLEALLKLPHTELAQRLVTASLQLEERSCCIALLQESLANHKEQMINKISCLEKQSHRNIAKVKQECEETVKRHQTFIDQLINDKKTLNHRIEQLVDERRSLEERWKRSAQALEERYKLELRNQHDKMAAAQQVARQRWVRQKAEKIKELTVKGLEGELREMAERQQKEIADMKMFHAEHTGRLQAKHAAELEELRRTLEGEREAALCRERHVGSSRLEKQILELELTYQEQRTRLVAEMRAENERAAMSLSEREKLQREELEKWKEEQEKMIIEKRLQLEKEIAKEKENIEDILQQKQRELEQKFEQFKKDFEAEQQLILKKKVTEIAAQHKQERDREIEKAIESMEAEAQQGRKELQEALRRNKEQYEAELKSLAETEQATLRRYQDAQARIRQTEDRCAELEVTISQLETRNKVLTEKNIQLENQAEEMKTQCDKAWHAKVESLQKEMEDMRKTHEEQMHQLYAKVKVAVARKDSAIQALTREAAKYQEKIALLESKLQQQRKDFLKQVK